MEKFLVKRDREDNGSNGSSTGRGDGDFHNPIRVDECGDNEKIPSKKIKKEEADFIEGSDSSSVIYPGSLLCGNRS